MSSAICLRCGKRIRPRPIVRRRFFRGPGFQAFRLSGWLPFPGLPVAGLTGDITLFPDGTIRLLGDVPWVDSGDPDEDCCCPGPPTGYECSTVCLTGPPSQVKATIAAMTPTFGCDNPSGCPSGDYFLDFVDTGATKECSYELCIDDPCNAGLKLYMNFVYLTGVLSGGLAWGFQVAQACGSCDATDCAVFNDQFVDRDISDLFDHIDPGADFDCNGIGPTSADQTIPWGASPFAFCNFTDATIITPIP